MRTQPSIGHSSLVRMRLEWDGGSVELAQLAPDWALTRTPRDIPFGPATVIVEVDGDVQRRPVQLPQGGSRDNPRIDLLPPTSL